MAPVFIHIGHEPKQLLLAGGLAHLQVVAPSLIALSKDALEAAGLSFSESPPGDRKALDWQSEPRDRTIDQEIQFCSGTTSSHTCIQKRTVQPVPAYLRSQS